MAALALGRFTIFGVVCLNVLGAPISEVAGVMNLGHGGVGPRCRLLYPRLACAKPGAPLRCGSNRGWRHHPSGPGLGGRRPRDLRFCHTCLDCIHLVCSLSPGMIGRARVGFAAGVPEVLVRCGPAYSHGL
jgi:hypothetical protein